MIIVENSFVFLFFVLSLLCFIVGIFLFNRRKKFIKSVGNPKLINQFSNLKIRKEKIKILFVSICIIFLVIASSKIKIKWNSILKRGAVDVIYLVDVSRSMSLDDFADGNRLEKVKKIMLNLLEKMNGNKVGIITYAGDDFIQAPLTNDYKALEFIIKNWININSVQKAGSTGIVSALRKLNELTKNSEKKDKLVIIFTDGGSFPDFYKAIINEVDNVKYKYIIVGIGSIKGSYISSYNYFGSEEKLLSRLEEETLKKFAKEVEGVYINGNDKDKVDINLLNKVIGVKERTYVDIYKIPLSISILIFLLVLTL